MHSPQVVASLLAGLASDVDAVDVSMMLAMLKNGWTLDLRAGRFGGPLLLGIAARDAPYKTPKQEKGNDTGQVSS